MTRDGLVDIFFADGRIGKSPAVAFVRLSGFFLSLYLHFWELFKDVNNRWSVCRAYQHDSLQFLARFNTLK